MYRCIFYFLNVANDIAVCCSIICIIPWFGSVCFADISAVW